MATVPAPRTWVAGEIATAAELNSNVRDSTNFFIARPAAALRQTVAQSVANTSWTAALWDTEDLNRDGMHSTVSNTSRLTAATAGWYRASTTVNWGSNNAGFRAMAYATNGGARYNKCTYNVAITAVAGCFETTLVFLNVGDYFEAVIWQSSGGSLSTQPADGDGSPRLGCSWLSTP